MESLLEKGSLYMLALLGFLFLKDLLFVRLRPEKLVTRAELEARCASCGGPPPLKEDIKELHNKTNCIDKKLARLIGGLEAKGLLEPEKGASQ